MLDINTAITAPLNALHIKTNINVKIAVEIEYIIISKFTEGLDSLIGDKNTKEKNVIPLSKRIALDVNSLLKITYPKKHIRYVISSYINIFFLYIFILHKII